MSITRITHRIWYALHILFFFIFCFTFPRAIARAKGLSTFVSCNLVVADNAETTSTTNGEIKIYVYADVQIIEKVQCFEMFMAFVFSFLFFLLFVYYVLLIFFSLIYVFIVFVGCVHFHKTCNLVTMQLIKLVRDRCARKKSLSVYLSCIVVTYARQTYYRRSHESSSIDSNKRLLSSIAMSTLYTQYKSNHIHDLHDTHTQLSRHRTLFWSLKLLFFYSDASDGQVSWLEM